jgi:ribosomal protein S12 methylthiotransferase accessory factor
MNFLENLNIKTELTSEKFLDIYKTTLETKNLPFKSFGKGFSLDEATKSAYGEMCERILTRNFLEEYYINGLYPDAIITDNFLNNQLYDFYNIKQLEKEDLFDFNSDIFDILSIPFTNPKTGEIVYFPINIIHNLYASNGMAYYTDLKTAYYNAKTEIIERFVKFQVIKYALPLPKISHPLNNAHIQIYDATLDGKYPVMAASFIENEEIILAFGCDLDREKAIKKAYAELLQTSFEKRGSFIDDIDYIKSPLNLTQHFIDLSGDIHLNFLKKPYFNKGEWKFDSLDVFSEDEYVRIYRYKNHIAVQIIIPSISEVYPIEDLAFNNINRGKFLRNDILNLKNKNKIIDKCYEYGVWNIGEFIGVIFDKNYTIENIDELYEGYKLSDEFINIQNLAKALK